MRFVGDDDDVVAPAVRVLWGHRLIEFLNKREDVGFVFICQHRLQLRAAPGPARIAIVVDNAATGKRIVNLQV